MKKIYEKPSMAVNSFDTMDSINAIKTISSATPLSGKQAARIGMTVINGGKLNS